jgi:hypothetical protein
VAGELDRAPDCLVIHGLGRDPIELVLDPGRLAGQSRTPEERQAAKLAEPLPETEFGLSRHV